MHFALILIHIVNKPNFLDYKTLYVQLLINSSIHTRDIFSIKPMGFCYK